MLHRAAEVSSKQCTILKALFIPLILLVIIYIYFHSGQKSLNIYKAHIIYPHWNKKQPPKCGARVQNDPILKVNNIKTYVVGSYVEHRENVKMIRTIAIVFRSENAEYHCLLCCNGQDIFVPATCDIHSDHFGFEYGTANIDCQIPNNCTKLTHVAITDRSTKEKGNLQELQTFQPVKNQQKTDDFPYEFTVCISVMYEYDNVLQFVQAMEMFKILGVQKVAIYKTSCTPELQRVMDYYFRQNFVEIIPWRAASYIQVSRGWKKSVSSGELHYFGQIAALNDCVYRYMYQSRYVALQDLDELILPMKLKSWTELLPQLEKKYSGVGGFEFENHYFPLSLKDSSTKYSPVTWKKVKGVNILKHIVRMSNDPALFNNFKVIVNPRLVFKTTVHGILQSVKGTVRVDPQIAHMYHIRNITSEILVKRTQILDAHLRDYANSLIPAVSKVLWEALGIYD